MVSTDEITGQGITSPMVDGSNQVNEFDTSSLPSSQYGVTAKANTSEIKAYEEPQPSYIESTDDKIDAYPSPATSIDSEISTLSFGANLNIITLDQSNELI